MSKIRTNVSLSFTDVTVQVASRVMDSVILLVTQDDGPPATIAADEASLRALIAAATEALPVAVAS